MNLSIESEHTGERVRLRAVEPSDIDLVYTWENDTEVWKVSNTITPFSRYVLEQYIISVTNSDLFSLKQLRLMIDLIQKDDLVTIGTVDLFEFDPLHSRVGVGILIDKSMRGNGYAKEALEVVVDYVFFKLQIHQLFCNIAADNLVSLQLFKSLGFEIVGLKKDWLRIENRYKDEYLLQLVSK